MKTDFKNILVVRTDRIGDVVVTIPALRALKKAFPRARLTVLVAPATRELLEGNPVVDEVIVYNRKGTCWGTAGFLRMVGQLRQRRFDLAINYHTKRRTNLLCFFSRIPRRVGYCNEKWGIVLTDRVPDDRPQGKKHEAQYCLDLLRPLGVEASTLETFMPVDKKHEDWARALCRHLSLDLMRPIIAIHPGASCSTKKWPARFFTQVVNQLQEKYHAQVILVGAADSRPEAQTILNEAHGRVFDLTGQTSLGQFVSLMRRCTMLISNDSGPVHLADAVGIGVVAIFTRNQPGINPERWRPLGPRATYVAPPVDLEPCFAKGKVLDPIYLEKVTVGQVMASVDAIYKLCYNQRTFLTA